MATSAEELTAQAEQMTPLVSFFTIDNTVSIKERNKVIGKNLNTKISNYKGKINDLNLLSSTLGHPKLETK